MPSNVSSKFSRYQPRLLSTYEIASLESSLVSDLSKLLDDLRESLSFQGETIRLLREDLSSLSSVSSLSDAPTNDAQLSRDHRSTSTFLDPYHGDLPASPLPNEPLIDQPPLFEDAQSKRKRKRERKKKKKTQFFFVSVSFVYVTLAAIGSRNIRHTRWIQFCIRKLFSCFLFDFSPSLLTKFLIFLKLLFTICSWCEYFILILLFSSIYNLFHFILFLIVVPLTSSIVRLFVNLVFYYLLDVCWDSSIG